MTRYYTVPAIGTGRDDDPFRPDLPDDVRWFGHPHTDGTFLVAVPDDSPIVPTRNIIAVDDAQLDAEATRRGARPVDVRRWHVASRRAATAPGSISPTRGTTR